MKRPAKITPMFRQYMEIKSQHEDAILFYRMGDFYEMFFDDAIKASKILGITLTSRNNKGDEDRIPMCGVPYHAASSYLAKLVKAGLRVAVCEQVEDPKQAKGVVKREVMRVVTPGVTIEDQLLDDKNNRYLAAIALPRKDKPAKKSTNRAYGLALLDITTGEFMIAERDDFPALLDELSRMSPSELLIPEMPAAESKDLSKELKSLLPELCLTERPADAFSYSTARETLLEHFKIVNLAGFGCENLKSGVTAAGVLMQYIQSTQSSDLSHIEKVLLLDTEDILIVDESSRRNLELIQTIVGASREGSLLAVLDQTCTPMGARLLKRQLLFPLRDVARINKRFDAVEKFFTDTALREAVREILAEVYDLERLNSKVVLGSANARDLTAMKDSLARLPGLKALLKGQEEELLNAIHGELDELADIKKLIDDSIREDAPLILRDGKMIKEGFNSELDELISIQRHGREMILSLESGERERTGIAKLKVGFNKVFGYYLEVSRGQLDNVPDYFIRKQTLVNAERFITPELKEFENKVMGAQERRLELEYRLFSEIRQQVADQSARIIKSASLIARIDFFASLAEAARRNRYVRPRVNDGEEITIAEGRHPVIEQSMPPGRFVANDIHLDQQNEEVLIITGPNMAGKSTVLRQTALIVLMSQMGCFVPVSSAEIGVVDRIFTRVGAMDDLRRGQSTFMVEMNETANILNNATEKSLVILDEIGRGTSTFDGLAIAWAVTEDLVAKNGKGVKTLFATHYHELTELALTRKRVKNYNIAVREWNDSIIFLYKLMKGSTNRSYGIQVAALAGVPARVVSRANEILHNIEKEEYTAEGRPKIAESKKKRLAEAEKEQPSQMQLFAGQEDPVRQLIRELKLEKMTPMEAINLLHELRKKMSK